MKKKRTLVKSVKGLFALTLLTFMTSVDAQQVRYKMTTDIPASITTPDSVKTSLGMLRFFDGFPDGATVQKLYDNLDFQRGVQAFLTALPSASMYATREGYRTFGPDNQTVKDFWSIIAYHPQTRSMHQTDQQFPSISSQKQDIIINPDSSVDLYFGPEAPPGKEANWLQTIPGKGWWAMLRLYGPLEPWFDKTWRPGEIELVK